MQKTMLTALVMWVGVLLCAYGAQAERADDCFRGNDRGEISEGKLFEPSAGACPMPAIRSMEPRGGCPGETITVRGLNFGDNPGVLMLADQPVVTTFWSSTTIKFEVPESVETATLSVTSNCGKTRVFKQFDFLGGQPVFVSIGTGSDVKGDGSVGNPYRSIGHAVLKAPGTDACPTYINVAAGRYKENVMLGYRQALLGGYNRSFSTRRSRDRTDSKYKTVIDGGENGSVVTWIYPRALEISGFTITGGGRVGNGFNPGEWGSGIEANAWSGVIKNNTITRNDAGPGSGGGIFCSSNSPPGFLIWANEISHNKAAWGGGLGGCRGTIGHNDIIFNFASLHGGGLYRCYGLIHDNDIGNNTQDPEVGGGGGGLHECEADIVDNSIHHNSAHFGGGVSSCRAGLINGNFIFKNRSVDNGGGLSSCTATMISENVIRDNQSGRMGGGLAGCAGHFSNNIIKGNRAQVYGGGVYTFTGDMDNNLIAENQVVGDDGGGGGIAYCDGALTDNKILGNTAPIGGGVGNSNVTIQGGRISDNHATAIGGGIWCGRNGPDLQNVNTQVKNNTSSLRPPPEVCPNGYTLLQDVDNIFVESAAWYECIEE